MFGRNRGGQNGGPADPAADAAACLASPARNRKRCKRRLDDDAPAAQIKDLLAKYKASQKAKQAKLEAAQDDLKAVLTVETGGAGYLLGLVR